MSGTLQNHHVQPGNFVFYNTGLRSCPGYIFKHEERQRMFDVLLLDNMKVDSFIRGESTKLRAYPREKAIAYVTEKAQNGTRFGAGDLDTRRYIEEAANHGLLDIEDFYPTPTVSDIR